MDSPKYRSEVPLQLGHHDINRQGHHPDRSVAGFDRRPELRDARMAGKPTREV